jgi:hypothetical protein
MKACMKIRAFWDYRRVVWMDVSKVHTASIIRDLMMAAVRSSETSVYSIDYTALHTRRL